MYAPTNDTKIYRSSAG